MINKKNCYNFSTVFFIKKYWDKILLVFLITTYTLFLSHLSISRHNAFASGFDLGNMDQVVWNTLNGKFFSLTNGARTMSRFSIHADLILVLLAPFYLIWNNVRMLLIIQTAFLALGAIPIFLLSKKLFKEKLVSLVFILIYLLLPGMQWTNVYDFHGVALAVPFLLFTFYFIYTKNWSWYWVFILLSLITKEQISGIVFLLGLYVLFFQKQKKIGLITLLISAGWFFLSVFFLTPQANSGLPNQAWNMFQFSDSKQFGLPSIEFLIQRFFLEKHTIEYYSIILKETGFLPLFGFPWLIFASPQFLINILSNQSQLRSIILHYDTALIPWLMIASIFGIKYLQLFFKKISLTRPFSKHISYTILFLGLLVCIRTNYHYSPLPTTPACWCYVYQVSPQDRQFDESLQKIPQSASVTASPEIRPHISHRIDSYTLPVATDSADFIAIIDQNRMIGNYEPKDFELVLRDQLKTSQKYTLIKQIGHFYLYKKNSYIWKDF